MDSGFTHVIILDFEATCDDRNPPQPQEIIEFPSLLLALESGEIVHEFESFVRPVHHPTLSEFCTRLTSISQADVDAAGTFFEVLGDHQAWLDRHGLSEKNALFVTCGDWDLGTMLPAQYLAAVPHIEDLRPIYTQWQNIKHAFCTTLDRPKPVGMARMLRSLALPLTGHHHRGIDDCRNIAEIYKTLLARGATVAPTAKLPIAKYPPVSIRLRLGDRVESVQLTLRSVRSLRNLAGRIFKSRISVLYREDGSQVQEDGALLTLAPDEEIRVS